MTQTCPFCGEDIDAAASVCPICGETVDAAQLSASEKKSKHLFAPSLDAISWDQHGSIELAWKYPIDDITLGSVLTVRESQEAYFFKNGELCDKFTAGSHTLSTQNLPLLNRIVKLPSGGMTAFKAEVWFLSKLENRNMLWGTGGMHIVDPNFETPVKVSSRGHYGVRIMNGAQFLKKLVGTLKASDMRDIEQRFRTDVIESVKVAIERYMKENKLKINELGSEYRKLAQSVYADIQKPFGEYGLELLNFNIENISIAETAAGNKVAGNSMDVGTALGVGQQMGQTVTGATKQSGPASSGGSPVPPPPPSAASFYVAVNGQTAGPFSMEKISEMIMSGKIATTTYVYRVGGTAWTAAQSEPEIAAAFAQLMPPPPPPSK